MARFVVKRLLLLGVTVWLASVLVFLVAEVMPGNIGRIALGPFATQAAVDMLNARLGADRPVAARYLAWAGGLLRGEWGQSLQFGVPVLPLLAERLGRSLMLAGYSLVLLVPFSVGFGIIAAVRRGGIFDRLATLVGLLFGAIPEFVTGVFMIVVFGLWWRLLPIEALPPDSLWRGTGGPHAGFWPQLWTVFLSLLMPALCLVLLLFTYLFRMTRTGVANALAADYTRTAVLKGLPFALVLRRHVLPNGLLTTIAVLGSQLGWLVGGLVVIETLFHYPGLGSLIQVSALHHDVPLLAGCTMAVAVVFSFGAFLADLLQAALNPRTRHNG